MRLRKIKGAEEAVVNSPYVINEPERYLGAWSTLFKNQHPIYLEIGCGKGRFISEMAALHPERNYIGIEKFPSVLLRAIEKREQYEGNNLYFLCGDAEELLKLFADQEVQGIYLNFSDPWPKERHKKRRLTSVEFLERYRRVLSPDAVIEFKTDNQNLYAFSKESAVEAGYEILLDIPDLHHSPYLSGNVMTEYEDRFVTLGNRIMKLVLQCQEKAEKA